MDLACGSIGSRAFKRSLLGYRPAAVEEALAARDAAVSERDDRLVAQESQLEGARRRIDELERVADRLSERVVARERELRALRTELERARVESDETLRALAALADELASVRVQARGQATRIRMRALQDAAEVSDRIAELARRPAEARERLLAALGEAIARLGGEPVAGAGAGANGANGHRTDAEGMFQGFVEVEVGPLSDFAQLVGFEDAAGGIGGSSEISVKRFAQGRATIELNLSEPVELLRELEERAPFEFRVRDTREDRVVLDLDDE